MTDLATNPIIAETDIDAIVDMDDMEGIEDIIDIIDVEEVPVETKPKKQYANTVRPPTEVALFDLQAKYLVNRDADVWTEMFGIIYNYARSLTLKKIKGKIYLEEDLVNDAATHAALKFMQRYNTDPNFKVNDSFAGVLKWKVIEALYGDYEEDDHVSLNLSIGDSNQGELGDTQVRNKFESVTCSDDYFNPERMFNVVDIDADIHKILAELDEELADFEFDSSPDGSDDEPINYERMAILTRMYLLLYLRKPKSRHAKLLFKKHYVRNYKEEQIIELTVMELRNRLLVM